ncbi:hypothetical protein HHL16_24320 [Pseudoflavitalea sp. G-6-1-2]|uniref:hypothetical protein n=1 Tax=Pseudoflavitalea sp. G-6-1-2 TaxID=2728841 RepID=UPI00146D656E|nr:hypothetical protein [Pseudoflavitalea sp. G-6-1-2]NML24025.1 hypothetical protein [Pseudoflavitalea sp. G-6-1-2]
MKQKQGFIKAGPFVVSAVYPPGFRELCRCLGIAPASAIEGFIAELSLCGVQFQGRTNAQAAAALLFNAMTDARDGLPDEPSELKRKIALPFLLALTKVQEQIHNPIELAVERKRIISEWYKQYEKQLACTGNRK